MKSPTHSLLALAALVATLGVSSASAQDVTNGYYVFTADASNGQPNNLDGSWVQFSGDQIVNFELFDSTITPNSFPYLDGLPQYGFPFYFPPLIDNVNAGIINSQTYASGNGTGPDAFSFEIGSGDLSSTNTAIFWFEGNNNVNGGEPQPESNLFDGMTFNTVPVVEPDPSGKWTYQSTAPGTSPAPDSGTTAGLFLAGMAALGVAAKTRRHRQAAA